MQILTAIIPLLPTLQKVPLHIASTEANLKEAIRKSVAAHSIASAQPTNSGSASGSRKRKLPKIDEQYTPSPSVSKRKRLRIDPSFPGQQQLHSPKSSRDSLLTQGGLSTINPHRSIDDILHPSSRSASNPVNAAQISNPCQRLSMQPPTPRVLQSTPSRRWSIFPPEMPLQPSSSRSKKRESTSDASFSPFFVRPVSSVHSATPVLSHNLNHSKSAFKLPTQPHIHTPARAGSSYLNDLSIKPSAPPPSLVELSVVCYWMGYKPRFVSRLPGPTNFFRRIATRETLH